MCGRVLPGHPCMRPCASQLLCAAAGGQGPGGELPMRHRRSHEKLSARLEDGSDERRDAVEARLGRRVDDAGGAQHRLPLRLGRRSAVGGEGGVDRRRERCRHARCSREPLAARQSQRQRTVCTGSDGAGGRGPPAQASPGGAGSAAPAPAAAAVGSSAAASASASAPAGASAPRLGVFTAGSALGVMESCLGGDGRRGAALVGGRRRSLAAVSLLQTLCAVRGPLSRASQPAHRQHALALGAIACWPAGAAAHQGRAGVWRFGGGRRSCGRKLGRAWMQGGTEGARKQ